MKKGADGEEISTFAHGLAAMTGRGQRVIGVVIVIDIRDA